MSILQRSRQHLVLTPDERALLKLLYMGIVSCGLTALTAAVSALAAHASNGQMDWSAVLVLAAGTFGTTFVEAGRKWVTAHLDGTVTSALTLLQQAKQSADTTKAPAK